MNGPSRGPEILNFEKVAVSGHKDHPVIHSPVSTRSPSSSSAWIICPADHGINRGWKLSRICALLARRRGSAREATNRSTCSCVSGGSFSTCLAISRLMSIGRLLYPQDTLSQAMLSAGAQSVAIQAIGAHPAVPDGEDAGELLFPSGIGRRHGLARP